MKHQSAAASQTQNITVLERSPSASSFSHQLNLLPDVAFSVLRKLPHLLVPLVLRLFGLANQGQLLLQPLPAFSLVLLCTQLHTTQDFQQGVAYCWSILVSSLGTRTGPREEASLVTFRLS